jgi:hypothetical protein
MVTKRNLKAKQQQLKLFIRKVAQSFTLLIRGTIVKIVTMRNLLRQYNNIEQQLMLFIEKSCFKNVSIELMYF